jgi:hypothetical protein
MTKTKLTDAAKELDLTISNYILCKFEEEGAPLYESRSDTEVGQAYLNLDLEDGEVSVTTGHYQGDGIPMREWHGEIQSWKFGSTCISGEQLEKLVQKALPLLARVNDGGYIEWDGSNHVGQLNEDASDAERELEDLLEQVEGDIEAWQAGDWFCEYRDSQFLQELSDAGSVEALIEQLESEVDHDTVIEGLSSYIEERVEEFLKAIEEWIEDDRLVEVRYRLTGQDPEMDEESGIWEGESSEQALSKHIGGIIDWPTDERPELKAKVVGLTIDVDKDGDLLAHFTVETI